MKESVEEKAQRYDEAIGKAKKWYDANTNEGYRGIFEEIFPELKKSEDERIRKGLISHLKELKERAVEGSFLKHPTHYDAWIAWLEKQGEQKPADKVEPKFKVGDTIKDPYGNLYHIAEILDYSYKTNDGRFILFKNQEIYTLSNLTAWSKEDEYCLDGAIDTEMYMLDVVNGIKKFDVGNESIKEECTKELNWLKSLKGRVQLKQEWSEEDEKMLDEMYKFFDTHKIPSLKHDMKDYAKFIKSFKPQNTWKPSITQLNALSIVSKGNAPDDIEAIVSLYSDLKKLKNI